MPATLCVLKKAPQSWTDIKKIKEPPDQLRPGAFCNTMFSDTGRKEAAIAVRGFVCFLPGVAGG
jgi:hypothetical protein